MSCFSQDISQSDKVNNQIEKHQTNLETSSECINVTKIYNLDESELNSINSDYKRFQNNDYESLPKLASPCSSISSFVNQANIFAYKINTSNNCNSSQIKVSFK